MNKKSKILFSVLFLLIATMAVVSLYKFFVFKNYTIEFEIACNPETEECLVYECDPEEDEECPEDPEERLYYYNLKESLANDIPLCNPNDESCEP